jgi:hypothetical protein
VGHRRCNRVGVLPRELSPRWFVRLYPKTGRASIPPEKLLRALLGQVLYSIASSSSSWTTTHGVHQEPRAAVGGAIASRLL